MKYTPIVIAILLTLTMTTAWACSGRIEGGIDHVDLERQGALALELAQDSDTIAVVQVLEVDYQVPRISVSTNEVIKGDLAEKAELRWDHDDRYGCKASVAFHNIRVKEGQEYLVYVQNGQLQRAAPLDRDYQIISFEKELEIVRATEENGPSFP